MKLLFPPLAQFIVYGIASYGLAASLPALDHGFGVVLWPGALLLLVGMVLLCHAVQTFGNADTTINPVDPEKAEKLVTTGLYRFSRNPMYLGMLLALAAGALMLQNIAAFAGPLLFAASVTILQIRPEERVLRRKFGGEYDSYCQQTRRWI